MGKASQARRETPLSLCWSRSKAGLGANMGELLATVDWGATTAAAAAARREDARRGVSEAMWEVVTVFLLKLKA
jgi:hypothetical protein